MRIIREIVRLHFTRQLSLRAISGGCNLSVSTVHDYGKKSDALGLRDMRTSPQCHTRH